jgi:hypothetical protein
MSLEFEIYTIEPYETLLQPLLIITKSPEVNYVSTTSGEFFIIIPDENNTLIWKEMQISKSLHSNYSFLFSSSDACIITREGKSAAETELKKHYITKHGNSILLTDLCKPKFIESEKYIIASYIMRGTCGNQIRQIRQTTSCESLSQFLHSLRNIPKITFSNENGYKSPYE